MAKTGPKPRPAADRFWAKVAVTPACWLWQGGTAGGGYGRFSVAHRPQVQVPAHRFAYEAVVGPIPEGLELDHLCRTPGCVNPAHLEPVTHAENVRRWAATITHCPHGHEYRADGSDVRRNGKRQCRTCNALRLRQLRRDGAAERAAQRTGTFG